MSAPRRIKFYKKELVFIERSCEVIYMKNDYIIFLQDLICFLVHL
uniref:Uncharacterized protein n=1 Tax=Anguilla anguilla TaxID=7936 RepID=A0A0E9UCQ1_ANGAN